MEKLLPLDHLNWDHRHSITVFEPGSMDKCVVLSNEKSAVRVLQCQTFQIPHRTVISVLSDSDCDDTHWMSRCVHDGIDGPLHVQRIRGATVGVDDENEVKADVATGLGFCKSELQTFHQ